MDPKMPSIDAEEQAFQSEVKAVKQWWTDPRWRYTRRPFTAEQIVAKRGNLKMSYPNNEMSKKLWRTLEGRFQASSLSPGARNRDTAELTFKTEQRRELHLWLLGSDHGDADGKVH